MSKLLKLLFVLCCIIINVTGEAAKNKKMEFSRAGLGIEDSFDVDIFNPPKLAKKIDHFKT